MYTIEKGIPAPQERGKYSRRGPYPFKGMDVGDSFWVGPDEIVTARSAATAFGRKNGWVFLTRLDKGGLRVWRIA